MIRVFLVRLIEFYQMLIILEVIGSWLRLSGNGLVEDIFQALSTLVEPYLGIFRRFIPPVAGMDFSPMVALAALQLVERVLL